MRSESFHTPGRLRLELRVPAGSIEIETAEGDETHVELEPGRSSDVTAVEEAVVEARETAGGHIVSVLVEDGRRRVFFGRTPEVRVRVRCPEAADVVAEVVSADVRSTGRLGSVELKTVSGDIALDRLDGDAAVKTVSGDGTIRTVEGRATLQTVSGDFGVDRVGGPLEVRTVSGDVRIDEAGAGVTGQTVSGDVRLGAVAEGSVVLKSVSGDLEIGIRRGSKLWVDAKSISGDTSSELAVGETPPNGEGPLVELRASAMSGDIRVVRA